MGELAQKNGGSDGVRRLDRPQGERRPGDRHERPLAIAYSLRQHREERNDELQEDQRRKHDAPTIV